MKTDIEDIVKFIGERVVYNELGDSCFWAKRSSNEDQMIVEMRAFGAVKRLFVNDDKGVGLEKANTFQNDLGNFIAQAITEKLLKEKSKLS